MPPAARVTRYALVLVPAAGLAHLVLGTLLPPADPAVFGTSPAPGLAAQTVLRILCTICVALTVVVGPGLFLRCRLGRPLLLGPAFVWVPGALLLAATGLVAWLLADRVDTQATALVILAPVVAALAFAARRVSRPEQVFVPGEAAVCGVLVLLVLIGSAKATWSPGPQDELYGATVSRTLEQGDRSDSRISYHVVQAATHGLAPTEPAAAAYFDPYTFSDRGPIAGLAATPVVATAGAEPPLGMPDQPWMPFDPQGFAAYRIAVMVLGATVVLAVFGLLAASLPRRVAWRGTLLVALTPFVVHEVYFTWPKLLAASFGVAALTALLAKRPAAAGLLLGLSYLAHPVGALIALTVVGVWLGGKWQERGRQVAFSGLVSGGLRLARSGLPVVAGILACVVVWRLVNAGEFSQSESFGDYPFQARGMRPVPLWDWAAARFRSAANTLVPFELLRWAGPQAVLSRPGTHVMGVSLLYWATLPGAVGIVYFPVFCVGLVGFARKSIAVFVAGIVVPFVIFTVCWGQFVTGMMREGLQGWIVVTLLAAFLGHSVYGAPTRCAGLVRVCLTLRGVEVLVMLVAAAVLNDGWLGDGPFLLTDLVALGTMVGAVGVMMALTWRAFAPAGGQTAPGDALRCVPVHGGREAAWVTTLGSTSGRPIRRQRSGATAERRSAVSG